MTILQGTMQDGTVIPVQVDAQGRLVAEGLPGVQGPAGPAGGSFPLPTGAAPGDVLGWDGSQLVWVQAGSGGGGGGGLQTAEIVYVSPQALVYGGTALQASGGRDPGSSYWSDITPPEAVLDYSSAYGLGAIFDDSDTTRVYWTGADYTAGNVTSATFNLSDWNPLDRVELLVDSLNLGAYKAEMLDANKQAIQGASRWLTTANVKEWLSVPLPYGADPRYLRVFSEPATTAPRLYFYGMKVNGERIVSRAEAVKLRFNADKGLDRLKAADRVRQSDNAAFGTIASISIAQREVILIAATGAWLAGQGLHMVLEQS